MSKAQGSSSGNTSKASRAASQRRRSLRISAARLRQTESSDQIGQAMNQTTSTPNRKMPSALKNIRYTATAMPANTTKR